MDRQERTPRPSVAIIGGGVIGLAIGWRLAQAGCPVAIFERGEAGKGASWAAAGMLAAGVETEPGELALHALNRDDAAQLRHTYDFQQAQGIALEWLSGAQAHQREPFLHPNLAAAVFCA